MKNGGIDLLSNQISHISSSLAEMKYEAWAKAIESPIERLLFVGIDALVTQECAMCFGRIVLADGRRSITEECAKEAQEFGALLLQYQHRLLDWRADFVLSAPSYSGRKIIIECDGHDFHERTKEQAAKDRSRDRSATAAGHRIFRFTGSEIYRDPLGCSRDALKHAIWLAELE